MADATLRVCAAFSDFVLMSARQRFGLGVNLYILLPPTLSAYACKPMYTHTHTHTHTHTLSCSINKSQKEKSGRDKDEDKRNLYLAKEGQIHPDSDAARGLSKADLGKRMKVP